MEKRQNGQLQFQALLQAHCGGEGNKSVRVKEAENLRTALTYKSKRTMSFKKFLTSMLQAMFTGFKDNGEVLTDNQKICLLFQKVQSLSLTQVKSALKVQSDLDTGRTTVTYDFIAKSFSVEAASLPDHIPNHQASGLESHHGKGSAPASRVKGPDGTIFTGHYPDWNDVPTNERSLVYKERKRLGLTGTGDKKTRRSQAKRYQDQEALCCRSTNGIPRVCASQKHCVLEEEAKRSVGAVCTQGEDFDSDSKDDDTKVHLLNLGNLSQRLIASVNVTSILRRVSQVAAETENVPQLKTFQSKGRHSSVSPEALSELWQIGLEVVKETLN
jgi:hypothetical protein